MLRPVMGRVSRQDVPRDRQSRHRDAGPAGVLRLLRVARRRPPGGLVRADARSVAAHRARLELRRRGRLRPGHGPGPLAGGGAGWNPSDCTLAIWHHPRFSTGYHGPTLAVEPFWDALYAADADLVVNGHDHDYERFAPVDPAGQPDADRGIRQFVAGAGGAALRPFEGEDSNSEVRDASAHGVLRLDLRDGAYDWEFIPVPGGSFTDQGSGTCH